MSNKDNMIWYAAGGAGILALLAILFGPQILGASGSGSIKGKPAPTTYLTNFTKKGCNCGV